jgi:hypothetical protein
VQNIISGRNILWPIFGSHTNDVFKDVSQNIHINKLLLYLVSYLTPYPMEANNLFVPALKPFVRTDTSLGALGPFFGLILISCGYITTKYLWNNANQIRNNTNIAMIAIITGVTIITIAINPGSWWIKYSPQIVLLPSIGLIILCINNKECWNKYKMLFITMFIINSGLFYAGSLILTSYRSYKFHTMEQQCKLDQCIYEIHTFYYSLLNQFQEDHLTVKLGNCTNKNIIWTDVEIKDVPPSHVCIANP